MSSGNKLTRRELFKTAAVVTPVAMTGCATLSSSDADPLVRTEDPVARAVAYYENTRDVPADNPLAQNHANSQKCANCIHRRGNATPDRIICGTFPGRTVSPDGWCSIWAQG
jgi:hypothetical protein